MKDTSHIYKYRTWNNNFHKLLLVENQLFFASPKEINDPFDFKISIDLTLLDSNYKREKFVNDIISEAIGFPLEFNISLELESRKLIHRLQNDLENLQNEYESNEFSHMNSHMGIISFSLRWNSILMWSHYAENHNGFCVGFNRNKMDDSNLFGAHGPVAYKEMFPKIDPLNKNNIENIIVRSHTKAQDWNYEEEYRFVNIFDDPNLPPEKRIIKFPEDCIEEVILGLNISDNNKNEITNICSAKNIPIFQIFKKRNEFALEKRLLRI